MVYTPQVYLFSAAIALVTRQISTTSLAFDPVTISGTTETLTSSFPAFGADIADQDCTFTVKVDPTLPDISTISTVEVTNQDLLANTSINPLVTLVESVGTSILSSPIPVKGTNQDAYLINATSGSTNPKDCATGWINTDQQKRRLEANSVQSITSLESFYGTTMELKLKNLPTVGVYEPSPWPGPYWASFQDSINVVWDVGQPSAAEKYALAFGLDVTDFMNKISATNGIDSMKSRKKCTKNSNDCANLTDGSVCAVRVGQSSGYCTPTWFGICHAWAPAAILEKEPNCPVTYNNVTFHALDIKALISEIYDGASISTLFLGTRFNGGTDSTDTYGRHSNAAYRDVNPALFHIIVANVLGKLNSTFVADVTAGAEVWNQPVRGFKVYEQTSMTTEKAAQTFYGLETYPWNAAAKSIVYVKTRLTWIVESFADGGLVESGEVNKYTTGAYYYYLLEMDDQGEIIGGEWVYQSGTTHIDFAWMPKSKPAADTVTKVGLSYADVSMLLERSAACSDSSASASSESTTGST